MHSTLLTLSALASTAFSLAIPDGASTDSGAPRDGAPFSLVAVSTNGVNFPSTPVIAHDGSLFVGASKTPTDHRVYLWTGSQATQGLYVDPSGFGAGVTFYATDSSDLPRNAQREKFSIDGQTRELTFQGIGGKACPTGKDGEWMVSFSELEKPEGTDGCVEVDLMAYSQTDDTFCEYSPKPE
ncbi:cell wall protein PhiA [Teratosphaeria destructans]|uniref:Cell wall protein PhiA n=1 Tax=Teratosphaeria destructans TaxID=418781 RepID=A0A9W7W2D4_9PEZI|nr:cell wall protein PhiA [Teratosphaeria destructans]